MSSVPNPDTAVSAVPPRSLESIGQWARRITPGRATLLSIFPVEMHDIAKHAGRTVYLHPAANKGKIIELSMNPERMSVQNWNPDEPPFTMTSTECNSKDRGYTLIHLVDTYQWVMNFERERSEPLPISALQVAEAYERLWIQGLRTGRGRIGIRVVDPLKKLTPQIDDLWEQQSAYFRSLVEEADKFDSNSDRRWITELHRAAAAWMGIENRPWAKPMEERHLKRCVACASDILSEALVCKECSTFLPEFYRVHKLPFEQDASVVEFFRRLGVAAKS